MKHLSVIAICLCIFLVMPLSAQNVAGGDYFFRLTHPDLLTSASSSAGGAFFSAVPGSIAINPALTAMEQRVMMNLGYTALFNSAEEIDMGGAGQVSVLFPSRWGVFTGVADGVFCDVDKLQLGNIINLRGGFSKDITDNLYVGMSLNGGCRWGDDTQWSLGVDMGFVYVLGNVSFLKDLRIGSAVTNLGKPYTQGLTSIGILKAGIAGTLFSVANDNLAGAFSADLSFPQFTNVVFDTGLQFKVADIITIKTAWQFNLKDTLNKDYNLMPAVGLTAKFKINAEKNEFLANKGWQQSEVTTSAAWQKLYGSVNAVSASAEINLGLQDTVAPEIILWGEK